MSANRRHFPRMLRYLKPYLGLLLGTGGLSIFIVASESISLYITGTLVNTIFNPGNPVSERPEFSLGNLNDIIKYHVGNLILTDQAGESLVRVCMVILLAFLSKNFFLYANSLLVAILNLKVERNIRNEVYGHAVMLPVTYYDRHKSGNVMSIIFNDVSMVNATMTNTLNKLITEPIRLIALVSMLIIIDLRMTLIVFSVYPFLGVIIYKIGKSVRRRSKRVYEDIAGVFSVMNETISGVRAVKMFNMAENETIKFRSENEKYVRSSLRQSIMRALTGPLTEIFGVAMAVSLLWFGGSQVLADSRLGADDFIRYVAILIYSYQPLKSLGGVNNAIQSGLAAAERVFGILDLSTEKLETPAVRPAFQNGLRFENVLFKYPQTEEVVLKGISMVIPKGNIVALVGASGSGKSTILDLVPRFYEVEQGAIYIDDTDIRQCNLLGLRSMFGIVSQETILFDDTVAANVTYGVENASEKDIRSALDAANARTFVEALPKGLDTVIGERGVTLSGGQCQRLAIARALLRNPPILILDEATSSLDTESERLVQAAINRLMENRTVLVVAHRLSTITHADKIIVLDAGRIVEEGTHAELLARNGKYRYFHDMQFNEPGKGAV